MKFLRKFFSNKSYSFFNLSKEIIIAVIVIISPVFYPRTANAGFFSYFFGAGDEARAQTLEEAADVPNSQNMALLKPTANANPSPNMSGDQPVLISENALLAEMGPSGTIYDIEEPVNTQISIYVVHDEDTLSEIANMFDVSVNTVIWANNLGKNPVIKKGQTLIILPITGIRHVVKKGDTIKGIVKKYESDLEEVLIYNDLSVDSTLKEGDTIIIPDAEPSAELKAPSKPKGKVPSYAGYYMRPIVGGKKTQGIHGNNGVDLAAPVGSPIYASAGGLVIAVKSSGGWNGGYGNYVIISHSNGTQTLYAHNSVNLVSVGQYVDKGDLIAKIGMTGKTTGSHVHFEIRGARNPF